MRKTFQKELSRIVEADPSVILLLGDIGVYGFSQLKETKPNQVFNIGILEQSMISVAAGLAIEGKNPVIHSIAPFLVERCLEQIKIDFGYQKLSGNLFSVGASFDYAALGATHHCPGDIAELLTIPEIEILIPGSPNELSKLIDLHLTNDKLTYFRLSEYCNVNYSVPESHQGTKIKSGTKATVICFGPTLDMVLAACENLDVEILYFNSISPFDYSLVSENCRSDKILLVEPFYEFTTASLILDLISRPIRLKSVGVPKKFIHNYGSLGEIYDQIGLNSSNIKTQLEGLISD
jgi:transketolase